MGVNFPKKCYVTLEWLLYHRPTSSPVLSTAYILATGPVYDATQPSRTNPLTTGPRTLSRWRRPDLAILSSHLIDRKVRANSQEEVTPQKEFSPDANKITTLSKNQCHASDVATKKPANKIKLMA